jgi:hypothetical protein
MTSPTKSEFASRDTVLKLLSDEETARVSTAESNKSLADGVDYVDLEQLDKGVQRANSAVAVVMGGVIPRSSVSTVTWNKIVAHLAPRPPT